MQLNKIFLVMFFSFIVTSCGKIHKSDLVTNTNVLCSFTGKVEYNISKDVDAVKLIVNSITQLLILERQILDKAGEANDEGTNSMMSDFITEQEKTVWMMNAWLGESI